MDTEYEATFANINKEKLREKLKDIGAKLVRKEFTQKRVAFSFPTGHEVKGGWVRVRDEEDKITVSIKISGEAGIDSQREIEIKVSNFDQAVSLLVTLGCTQKAYQETKRELWELDGVAITIDEWPFLEPFVEIEGKSEQTVKSISEKLGFNYSEAIFDSVDYQYSKKYNISKDRINNNTPKIIFDMENPFL